MLTCNPIGRIRVRIEPSEKAKRQCLIKIGVMIKYLPC